MSLKTKLTIVVALLVGTVVILVVTSSLTGPQAGRVTAGFTAEFIERPDGYRGLMEAYDFQFAADPMQMDPGLMYKACADGAVDVICAFATDGRIAAYDLFTLEDDKKYFPPYYAAPVVRSETLARYPKLEEILNRLTGKLDDATMRELNLQVDREKNPRKATAVAREFLVSSGLIPTDAKPGDGSEGTIRIGGKDFTEQSILGEIMAILIECSSNIKVERKLYLGGTMICFNALKSGDLDVYAEYTGTGLVSILQRDAIPDPDKAYLGVKEDFKDKWNLVWLDPFGFNNTYTLTMRHKQAQKLDIRTFSDLAQYVRSEE
ncbi:MAG: glycine betaine ABC transporter substrate-binding protein [Planctomycetota bacterium]|nr:glycine betaine ABC transporter substrate-binding protein [Planctomycetota bacterium]